MPERIRPDLEPYAPEPEREVTPETAPGRHAPEPKQAPGEQETDILHPRGPVEEGVDLAPEESGGDRQT